METEPLLGLGFVRRENYFDPTRPDRRDSSDSTMSTSTRTWGWHEDEPVVKVTSTPATVASTTEPKKPKGVAAIVKWSKTFGQNKRTPPEREWLRP